MTESGLTGEQELIVIINVRLFELHWLNVWYFGTLHWKFEFRISFTNCDMQLLF